MLTRLLPSAGRRKINGLSQPEKKVIELAAEGNRADQIAARLHRSIQTVRSHVRSVKIKLGAKTTTQAAVIAVREGHIK